MNLLNALLLLVGAGSIYALFLRVKDFFTAKDASKATQAETKVDQTIDTQAGVINQVKQEAQGAIDDYHKLKNAYAAAQTTPSDALAVEPAQPSSNGDSKPQ